MRLFYGYSHHNLRSDVNKVDFQYFGYEWEATGSTEVTFNDFDVVVFSQILNVKRAGNVKSLCNLRRYFFNSSHCLHVKFLWREADCCVTGVNAGKFNVL